MRAASGATGSLTRVPSASGTRIASACAPSSGCSSQKPACGWAQEVCSPSRQNSQLPSEMANGDTTRSPRATVVTSGPVSSTMPMNS